MMIKKSIKKRLVGQFVFFVTSVLLLVIATASYFFTQIMIANLSTNLSLKGHNILQRLEQRVTFHQEQVAYFSRNHFVVNSLVDLEGRSTYLPNLVSDFNQVKDVFSTTIVDFEGKTIYSTMDTQPVYLIKTDLYPTLSRGQSFMKLSPDKTRIAFVRPIDYYRTPQGAAIVEVNLKDMFSQLIMGDETTLFRLYSEDMIVAETITPKHSFNFFKVEHRPEIYSKHMNQLKLWMEIGVPSETFYRPIRYTVLKLLSMGLFFTVIAAFVAYKIGQKLASPILRFCEKIEKGDRSVRFSPVGTGDELEVLAEAFDKRDKQLQDYRESLEDQVKTRTKELVSLNVRLRQEINERQLAGIRLEQSELRHRAIVDNLLDGIITIDDKGIIHTFNPAAEEIFGYRSSDVMGKNVSMLIPEPHRSKHDDYLKKYVNGIGESVLELEISGQRKDGDAFPMDIKISRMGVGGNHQFVGVFRDISERKEAENRLQRAKHEAEVANRAKSEFLANMSHEIRTPMNAVIGMVEVLSESDMCTEDKKHLDVIRTAGEGLLDIINAVLDLSKIEAGQCELEKTPFSLKQIVETTCEMMAFRSSRKGIDLSCCLHPDVPDALSGDPVRLRQVLVNLMGNAMKFTEEGEVLLSAEPAHRDDSGVEILFWVKDTGPGIAGDKIETIFHSFSQGDASTTRKFGGTGLGLTISKKLVEMMGGRIWMESRVGEGSTFLFTARFETVKGTVAAAAPTHLDLKGVKILVVNANDICRPILCRKLEALGADVHGTAHGENGIAAMGNGRFDLIIASDVGVPEMKRITFLSDIQDDPLIKNTPVILIASAAQLGDKTMELPRTCSVIPNPYKEEDLMAVIASILKTKIPDHMSTRKKTPVVPDNLPALSILLAEDTDHNVNLIKTYFDKLPFTIDVAENGRIALEKFKAGAYDMVLMDIEMPEMDGIESTQKIRAWEKEQNLPQTPVIALTAHALGEHERRSVRAGCDDHLTKPIKKGVLVKTILKYTT